MTVILQIFLSNKAGLTVIFRRAVKGGETWFEGSGNARGTAAGMLPAGTMPGAATMSDGTQKTRKRILSAI